jgi:hypothetical protein
MRLSRSGLKAALHWHSRCASLLPLVDKNMNAPDGGLALIRLHWEVSVEDRQDVAFVVGDGLGVNNVVGGG